MIVRIKARDVLGRDFTAEEETNPEGTMLEGLALIPSILNKALREDIGTPIMLASVTIMDADCASIMVNVKYPVTGPGDILEVGSEVVQD